MSHSLADARDRILQYIWPSPEIFTISRAGRSYVYLRK